MSWNYRVVRQKNKLGTYYGIHEVYYNKKGKVSAMTQDLITPCGDTLEELKEDLQYMLEACNKPVLDYNMKFN